MEGIPAAAVVGALVALLVAMLSAVVNYLITQSTLQHAAARDIGRLAIDFKMKQLNELHGPLLGYLEECGVVSTVY